MNDFSFVPARRVRRQRVEKLKPLAAVSDEEVIFFLLMSSQPSPIALLQSVEAVLDPDYDNMDDDDGSEPLSFVDPSMSALWGCHSLGNSLNRVPPNLLPSLFATPSRTRAAPSVHDDVDMESNDADFILKVQRRFDHRGVPRNY